MNLLGLVTADYGVLVAYLVLMVLVGIFFSRRQDSSSEFFLAGRSMGWFPIGISVMATLLSALSYSGVPGESYHVGFHYLLLPAMVWFCIPLMLKVVLLYSSLLRVPSLARAIRSRLATAISIKDLVSQLLMPGTINPASSAMAMPIFMLGFI